MKLFGTLILFLAVFSGQILAQETLPATYQVVNLARADNLNVRTGPGVRFADVGSIPPFTTVTVIGFNSRRSWAQIEWEGGTGWVSAQFIEPASVGTVVATETQPEKVILTGDMLLAANEVSCIGTEPFWGLDIMEQTQLTYSTPDTEPVTSIIESINVSANNPSSQMFSSFGFTGIVHRQQCSDGASDTIYNWAIDLVVNDGFGAKLYSGCCSIVQN